MKGRLLFIKPAVLLSIFIIFSGVSLFAQSDSTPDGWVSDIREAQRIAAAENKKILVNFTGSDWCQWCFKLRDEVFLTPAFKNYAKDKLVLLYVDFPNRIVLSQAQQGHNQLLAQTMGVRGYPTIFVLESDLTPRLQTGYKGTSPMVYSLHLDVEKNIQPAQAAAMKAALLKVIPTLPAL